MDSENLKRRLAAILAADVAGYSRLMSVDEPATVSALDRARGVFRESIQANQGRVIDMAGDSVLAVFETAAGAITSALAIQQQLHDSAQDVPEEQRMLFRIGIHLGDVIEKSDGTIYGDGVNVAARLEGLSQPGGVAVSDMVYGAVRDRVSVRFEDAGEHEVKNIARAVHAYHALPPGIANSAGDLGLNDTNGKLLSESVPPTDAVGHSENELRQPRRTWITGAAASILLGFAVVMWLQPWKTQLERADPAKMAFTLPDKPSIAVLPFDNMSDDTAQEYFSDGMTEDITTDLSKMSGLFVVARNSAFSYKGRAVKIRQVAEELGVRYVLEGSVRRAADQVRINAQLIDAITGGHLWAERYDGNVADVFALQDRITAAIVKELSIALLPSEQKALANNNTSVPEAHDAFLLGWAHLQSSSLDGYRQAKVLLEKAVALDPNYGQAWGALAELYYRAAYRGFLESLGLDEGGLTVHLEKALARPTVQAYRAQLYSLFSERRFREMPAVLDRMENLEPNYSQTYIWRGVLAALNGNTESAFTHFRAAQRLDPIESSTLALIGRLNIQTGRYAEAVKALELSAALNPDDQLYISNLVAAYALAGQTESAHKAAERLLKYRKAAGFAQTTVRSLTESDLNNLNYRVNMREGLRLAGIPEVATAKDFNVLPEHRVLGAQLRELLENVRLVGRTAKGEWMQDLLADGTGISYWVGREVARRDWHIEGDKLHARYRAPSTREPRSCEIYRNPKGTKETLDQYLSVCGHGIFPFATSPLPASPE